jgi:site-specific recombinase XerD
VSGAAIRANWDDAAAAATPETIQRLKSLVLDSVHSPESKRAYGRGLERFLDWFQSERPTTGFTKATVQRYRAHLVDSGLSSSTVNLYMTAIRRLAVEAADNGLMQAELASGIGRVSSTLPTPRHSKGSVIVRSWQ